VHGNDRGEARYLHQDMTAEGREITVVATSDKGCNEKRRNGCAAEKKKTLI
jgi:hypothetical protein